MRLSFDAVKNFKIERVCARDADALTEVAVAAKRHWGYPEAWISRWRDALTITPRYVDEHPTYAAVTGGGPVGFCAVQLVGAEAVLDHLWVLPAFMGRGIGRALFGRTEEIARAHGAVRMRIVGDPHAERFYARMGATLYGKQAASMDGEARFLPLFEKVL